MITSSSNDAPVSYQLPRVISPFCKAQQRFGSKKLTPFATNFGTFIYIRYGMYRAIEILLPFFHATFATTANSSRHIQSIGFVRIASPSSSTNPCGISLQSSCTVRMCFALPKFDSIAQYGSRSGYSARNLSKSITCPRVLSITVTPGSFAVNGLA